MKDKLDFIWYSAQARQLHISQEELACHRLHQQVSMYIASTRSIQRQRQYRFIFHFPQISEPFSSEPSHHTP